MAAGPILSVLAQIPWGKVLDNAPDLADRAGRLWRSVARSDDAAADRLEAAAAAADPAAASADPLTRRLQVAEQDLARLHAQMQDATALIRSLTEQNAQLVQRADAHRRSLRRLAWATGLAVAGLAALLVALLLRTA